ncbi:MAG: hypothetical protein LBP95_10705 [Deltaproteobacteria bacterium]|nr:hypothetical protein [Deltaproteobacteria bacterium]
MGAGGISPGVPGPPARVEPRVPAAAGAADGAGAETGGRSDKPFRLTKYFSLVAVVSIFVTCLFLAVMMSDRAEKIISDRVVDETVMIMDNLNYQMFNSFLLPIYRSRGEARLSLEEPYRFLDAVIQGTVHGFDISRVALYDAKFGMMVYSSESPKPVVVYEVSVDTGRLAPRGQLAEPMSLYLEAIRVSLLANGPGGMVDNAGGAGPGELPPRPLKTPGSPDRAAYINYLKERTVIVRQEGGYLFGKFFPRGQFTIRCLKAMEDYYTHNISGVLELTRDLSAEYRQIAAMQYRALIVAVATALFLSFVLWVVVARGESIINQKNAEKLALDERLHRAERLANLGQMVATVSHEIRNPLGIIRSSADFLAASFRDGQASTGQRRLAGAIVDEAERLWRILTDFLDFARPMKPSLEAVVVEDILEEILVLLEADMSAAGVELVTRLRPDPGPILADPGLLHQVFMNLLVNAIQAMPDGGLLFVGTSVDNPGDARGFLAATVQDTGPGLSEEASAHLFRPFHTTKTKGTGLGLVLVRNVVESHAGALELQNVGGGPDEHGLLATVRLPLRPADHLAAPAGGRAPDETFPPAPAPGGTAGPAGGAGAGAVDGVGGADGEAGTDGDVGGAGDSAEAGDDRDPPSGSGRGRART